MDYSKQCWFCGKVTMVKKGNYYQCSECGATWNEQPNPCGETRVLKRDFSLGSNGVNRVETYSPSHLTQEAARKARGAKGG